MSRRKQTKPYKVEEKLDIKQDKKPKLRRILPRRSEGSLRNDIGNSGNVSDADVSTIVVGENKRNRNKCDKCGKILASALSLARHKLTHSENKPFQCTECGAGFKTSSNMHRHLRIHFREAKEQSDSELVVTKPQTPTTTTVTQRPPRQNIRPNKFREFDVDLVGVTPRASTDVPSTNARSYSKSKDSPVTPKKQIVTRRSVESNKEEEKEQGKEDDGDVEDFNIPEVLEDLPELNVPRRISKTESSRSEDYVCQICHKSFISKFGLITHTSSHTEEDHSPTKLVDHREKVICDLCDQTFSTPKGLNVHNVIVHKIAGNKGEVVKKVKSFKDVAIIDFSVKKFPVIAEAACNLANCAPPKSDMQHIFICKKCDKAFPLLESLEIHVNKMHQAKPQTPQTNKKTKIGEFLKNFNLQHIKTTKRSPMKDNARKGPSVQNGADDDNVFASKLVAVKKIPTWLRQDPNLTISTYQKESETEPSIFRRKVHFDGKTTMVKYTSSNINSSRNTSETGLSLFVQNARRRTRNQVDSQALLRSFDPNLRRVEVDRTNGEKNVFWCRICNYSSHEKSALIRHLLTHSGIRPYFCKICDYAFTTKANCERHVRKRHRLVERAELDASVRCDWELLKKAPREDIYMISGSNSSCPVCNKTFTCNNDLKMHMKTHEERHFACQLCNVRCTTRNNCVRHILHKHPGIPHKEANNIITFVGKSELDLDNPEDMVMDRTEIDISKGRLGGKRRSSGHASWLPGLGFSRSRTNSQEPLSKVPRLSTNALPSVEAGAYAINDQDSNIPMSLPESDVENNEDTAKKTSKLLPLIPLLKIKAYNEAAARSYAEMVTLYQHLNFLHSAENNPITSLDDTNIPMLDSPVKIGGNDFCRGETMFICRSCEKSFDTEDELNGHILTCEGAEEEDMDDHIEGNNEMLQIFNGNENGVAENSENVFAHDVANGGLKNDDGSLDNWDLSMEENLENNEELEMNNPLSIQGFESGKSDAWPNRSDANSPFSVKSGANSTDFESPYVKERPQVSYTKDTSYVEDSLLLSMFADDDKNDENSEGIHDSPSGLSLTRYSSSFPTMVDIGNPTGGKYKGGVPFSQLDDEKPSLISKSSRQFSGRKCPQCNKSFPWASSLRRHIMTHTGLKLYMCRLCKMRFTTRSNLIRHVYRRHGMAKQHPDFASCLAKLHPSDTLLREVEADVRRRIDGKRKRIPGTRNAYEPVTNEDSDKDTEESNANRRQKKGKPSDFQSMLEEDPETMLVDLDYSPRDEMGAIIDGNKTSNPEEPEEAEEPSTDPQEEDNVSDEVEEAQDTTIENDQSVDMTPEKVTEQNKSSNMTKGKSRISLPMKSPIKEDLRPSEDETQGTIEYENTNKLEWTKPANKGKRSKEYCNFVCGLCKKIFKNVEDLRTHLDTHNVPHSWHCPVCGVPFTNKYNCQRHISRRHDLSAEDAKPIYVEDRKHGPRTARGHPRKSTNEVLAIQ